MNGEQRNIDTQSLSFAFHLPSSVCASRLVNSGGGNVAIPSSSSSIFTFVWSWFQYYCFVSSTIKCEWNVWFDVIKLEIRRRRRFHLKIPARVCVCDTSESESLTVPLTLLTHSPFQKPDRKRDRNSNEENCDSHLIEWDRALITARRSHRNSCDWHQYGFRNRQRDCMGNRMEHPTAVEWVPLMEHH